MGDLVESCACRRRRYCGRPYLPTRQTKHRCGSFVVLPQGSCSAYRDARFNSWFYLVV